MTTEVVPFSIKKIVHTHTVQFKIKGQNEMWGLLPQHERQCNGWVNGGGPENRHFFCRQPRRQQADVSPLPAACWLLSAA